MFIFYMRHIVPGIFLCTTDPVMKSSPPAKIMVSALQEEAEAAWRFLLLTDEAVVAQELLGDLLGGLSVYVDGRV